MIRPFDLIPPERAPHLEVFYNAVRSGDSGRVQRMAGDDPSLLTAYAPNQWCCRETPLNTAVSAGSHEMAGLLLELGADPNQASAWWAGGFRPLHLVDPARQDLVDLLLGHGAVVDVHAASHLGLLERLCRLLDQDPFLLHQPGGDGGRPLHFARDPDVATELMDRGALLELRDVDHGSTAAQWAVPKRPQVCRAILDRGGAADPFMLAALGDASRLEGWLRQHPGDARAVLTREAFPSPGSKAGHMYAFTMTGYGSALIHTAAKFGSVEVIELLVAQGADLGARGGYDEQTPLHTAASHDHSEAVRALVGHGADVNALSGPEHRTPPLVWAIVFGAARSADALMALGARVDAQVLRSAEAGARGEYRQFSKAPLETWEAILTRVKAGASDA